MKLFEEVIVWAKTIDGRLVKYRCFKDISTNLYAVQSSDYFDSDSEQKQLSESEQQAIELFIEESPETRCTWHNSLTEAIKEHEKIFSE